MKRASNVKIGVECQIFDIVIFFNYSRVLQFGALSRFKRDHFLWFVLLSDLIFMSAEKNQNKHSTLNLSFNALSKWHEPGISFLAFLEDVTYVFLLLFLSSYLQYYLCSFFVICIFSVRKKWSLKRDDYSIAFEMNSRKRAAYWSGSMVEIFSTLLKDTMGTIHKLCQHNLRLLLAPLS